MSDHGVKRMTTHWLRHIVLFALLMLPALAFAQTTGGVYVVEAGQQVAGDVATTTQSIAIKGEVLGDVTSWTGNIEVSGDVQGDVVSYFGHVMVAKGGEVKGHILSLEGGVERQQDAKIAGAVFGTTPNPGALSSIVGVFIPRSGQVNETTLALGRVLIGVALAILVFAFTVLWAALWPQRTRLAAQTLRAVPGRATTVGLLTGALLALVSVPVGLLLVSSVVGIPLIALLVVVVNAPYIYAFSATAATVGGSTTSAGLGTAGILCAAIVAGAIGWTASVAPIAGLVLIYLLASPGLGAVILSRGGVGVAHAR